MKPFFLKSINMFVVDVLILFVKLTVCSLNYFPMKISYLTVICSYHILLGMFCLVDWFTITTICNIEGIR